MSLKQILYSLLREPTARKQALIDLIYLVVREKKIRKKNGTEMGQHRLGKVSIGKVNNVNIDKEWRGNSSPQSPKTDLHKLPSLNLEKGEIESIAQDIVEQLGDQKSFPFYYLVASKVPKQEIYATLSNLKQGGTTSQAKVFVSRMKSYAAQKADTRTQSLYSAMQDIQKRMTLN